MESKKTNSPEQPAQRFDPAIKKIERHQVTWYSKLLAAILFLAVLPTGSFYVGKQLGFVDAQLAISDREIPMPVIEHEEVEKPLIMSEAERAFAAQFNDPDAYATAKIARDYPQFADEHIDCSRKFDFGQFQINMCTGYETMYYQAQFDNQYTRWLSIYDPVQVEKARMLWNTLSDLECETFAEDFKEGSIYSYAIQQCLETLTRSHMDALDSAEAAMPRG